MTRELRGAARRGWREVVVYVGHVGALFWPGRDPGSFEIHPGGAGDLSDWTDEELHLLVEQGRLQLARQRREFDRIQTRAQWLFTTVTALLGLLVSQTKGLPDGTNMVLWFAGIGLALTSLLGAGAVMTVRGTFGEVDTCLLSRTEGDVVRAVAHGYVSMIPVGENTVGTRLTVFRGAVFLAVVGGTATAVVWLGAA